MERLLSNNKLRILLLNRVLRLLARKTNPNQIQRRGQWNRSLQLSQANQLSQLPKLSSR